MMPLKYTIKVRVVNGQTLNVQYFVRILAIIRNLQVRLFLRVIYTPLPIVLGYQFLYQFNPKINWKHRSVQITNNGVKHMIQIINAYKISHHTLYADMLAVDLKAVETTAEIPQQMLTDTTPAHYGAARSTGKTDE